MNELDVIAEKIEAIAGIVDCVCVWLDEDADVDRAIEHLADVVLDCGKVASELREIAGRPDDA